MHFSVLLYQYIILLASLMFSGRGGHLTPMISLGSVPAFVIGPEKKKVLSAQNTPIHIMVSIQGRIQDFVKGGV